MCLSRPCRARTTFSLSASAGYYIAGGAGGVNGRMMTIDLVKFKTAAGNRSRDRISQQTSVVAIAKHPLIHPTLFANIYDDYKRQNPEAGRLTDDDVDVKEALKHKLQPRKDALAVQQDLLGKMEGDELDDVFWYEIEGIAEWDERFGNPAELTKTKTEQIIAQRARVETEKAQIRDLEARLDISV